MPGFFYETSFTRYSIVIMKSISSSNNEREWERVRERVKEREWVRERVKEREWDWVREKESETEREREWDWEREWEWERESEWEWEREWEREWVRVRLSEREREWEWDWESESETERERERVRESEREWEREWERALAGPRHWSVGPARGWREEERWTDGKRSDRWDGTSSACVGRPLTSDRLLDEALLDGLVREVGLAVQVDDLRPLTLALRAGRHRLRDVRCHVKGHHLTFTLVRETKRTFIHKYVIWSCW